MLRAVKQVIRKIAPRARRFKFAEQITDCIKPDGGTRYVLFGYKIRLVRIDNRRIYVAAVEVASGFQSHCRRLRRRIDAFVSGYHILQCAAVRRYIPLEPPFAAKYIGKQLSARTARLAVQPVVCAHNSRNSAFDRLFKRGKIRFPKVMPADNGIEAVPESFGTGMCGKMLCAGCRFQKFPVALYALYIRHGESGRKKRILAERLLSSSPSRIAEYVYVRSPECQSFIYIVIPVPVVLIEFYPRFR